MPWYWLLLALGFAKVVVEKWNVKVGGPWGPVIILFGGRVVPVPAAPSPRLALLDRFLRDSGVTRWSAEELTRPSSPRAAAAAGFDRLIPPLIWWHRFAAMALAAQGLDYRAPNGTQIRNLYRPEPYNTAIGGASESYHVTAGAIDVDFVSRRDREAAELWIRRVYCKQRWLKMGLGVGRKTIHLDFLGDRSRPWQWAYDDTVDVPTGRISCPRPGRAA